MRNYVIWIFAFSIVACKGPGRTAKEATAFNYEVSKRIIVDSGAVASAHPLASRVGVEVMKKGGNAFDAAIATQLALAVVYPGAGNIGGGGFMVARSSKGELLSLDFRETAPASAFKDMYLDSSGNVVPGKSTRGPSSSGVPGTIAGIFEIMKYAKLNFTELIDPAILLAEKGFAITRSEAAALNGLHTEFIKNNRHSTAFQKDAPWNEGDTLFQPQLAGTLKRIASEGAKGFYEGETAKLIVDEMQQSGGYISTADLKNYKAIWRTPHTFSFRNHEIVTMGLPSSGGILLNQMLVMIENRNMGTWGHLSAASVQLMVEAERRAYADRAQFLGDEDFYQVPVKMLTDRKYLNKRMQDYVEGVAGNSLSIGAGSFPAESEETTHLSIIDKEGNAVAVTTTLNDAYGSKTVVAGAGFLLNNEMDDFSIKPGEPNIYGAVGGEANAIQPGKRMLSSMSPTIVLKNSKPFLIIGTPGGTTIPTSVFQTIVNIICFDLSTTAAVNSPKFHHQWLPDVIYTEAAFPDSTGISLSKMGYVVEERSPIGRTEVIKMLNNGKIEAVADIRGDDSAEGW